MPPRTATGSRALSEETRHPIQGVPWSSCLTFAPQCLSLVVILAGAFQETIASLSSILHPSTETKIPRELRFPQKSLLVPAMLLTGLGLPEGDSTEF